MVHYSKRKRKEKFLKRTVGYTGHSCNQANLLRRTQHVTEILDINNSQRDHNILHVSQLVIKVGCIKQSAD